MKKNFICGLDIGSYKICATCGIIDSSGKIDVLATHTLSTQGLQAGRIIDGKRLSACIREAIKGLRKMCGIRVRRVYANIDSPDLRAKTCEKEILFEGKVKIKKSHLEQLVNSVISSRSSWNRKVIHTGLRDFLLDKTIRHVHPEGHLAKELKVEIVTVSALIPTIKRLIKSIKAAGLMLEDMVPSGCAQAWGFFRDFRPDPEKVNILIDVGSTLTKIALLKGRLIRNMLILPQGAQCITENIAVKLKLSFNCAEQLKTKYGRTHCEEKFFSQKIIVRDKLINKIVQPQYLYESIDAKVDYLLQEIKQALIKLNYKDEKVTGIIVTGGGSILEGFLERAEKTLEYPVKMGFLSLVKNHDIQAQSALYATSIGLIHFGFKHRIKLGPFIRAKFNPLTQTLNQVRDLYREYF